ncbi:MULTISPECIES: response regulator transcription factor [unclassified Pedobacter]|uniref:response regulator n=1 Tax=unclassified Pedobacter TaxID=2628915 RepID=UPI001D7A67C8|nr:MULTISPECIES: response regulator transcription factor [unclassified Pedobacter]CAH0276111.1 Transcriptional regulatory protein DegU [Pedobacter sp. Bi36]CAH0295849.1 Transcriptional regulatory protein DegU [Pedobacter sp. Bi126]
MKVILAEDHNIVRNGIKMLLESQGEVRVVAEANNGLEVLSYFAEGGHADIVIADINMPEMDGISLIGQLRTLSPSTHVVMLSMLDNEKYVAQAFIEGARGYLLKNVGEDELNFALRYVAGGGKYLCAELAEKLLDKLTQTTIQQPETNGQHIDFSLREMEVLHLIAEGYTNTEMADKLFLSKRTIEGHRQALIDKTGAKNTAALIRFAVVNGFIS